MFFFNIKGITKNEKWSDYLPQSQQEYNFNIEVKHEILDEILKLNIVLNFDKDSMESNHYIKLINKTYKFNQKYKEIKINETLIDTQNFLKNIISNIISFFSNLMKFYKRINEKTGVFNAEHLKKAIIENDEYFKVVNLNFETVYNCLTFFFKYSLMDDYTNYQRNILANISKIISCELMTLSGNKPNDITNKFQYSPLVQDFKNKKRIKEESMAMEINQIEKININQFNNLILFQQRKSELIFQNIKLFSQEIKSENPNSQSSKGPILLTSVPIVGAAVSTLLSPRLKSSTDSLSIIPEETENISDSNLLI